MTTVDPNFVLHSEARASDRVRFDDYLREKEELQRLQEERQMIEEAVSALLQYILFVLLEDF